MRNAATFDDEIGKLPGLAAGLKRAGVTRLSTWISPASDTHTYLQNFKRHVTRVGEIARVQRTVPTMLRRSDVKSPIGRVKFPPVASENSRSTGTMYVLKAS